jgi:hypothetical protein
MAKVFRAICLEDFTPAPEEDASFTLKRGREYIISPERDGQVRVFTRYWVWVPARVFAGREPL